MTLSVSQAGSPPVNLVTGGAGFIGANVAERLCQLGQRVRLLDNLARSGVDANIRWLEARHGSKVNLFRGDVSRFEDVFRAAQGVDRIFHCAAQVAVTSSISDPVADFETNARGTLNVVESARWMRRPPAVLFTSTNKVYGSLTDLALQEGQTRYVPLDARLRTRGVDEAQALAFHSPYGCSKGAAEQYVLDYARTYGIPAVVFRMSCIYGPRQLGTEAQGWVAHILRRTTQGKPVTLFGSGKQVRDLLYISDLVDALMTACERLPKVSGRVFNIGGGPQRSVSLLELLQTLPRSNNKEIDVTFAEWRPGDQLYYVSDHSRFAQLTGWRPRVSIAEGLDHLHAWIRRDLQERPGADEMLVG